LENDFEAIQKGREVAKTSSIPSCRTPIRHLLPKPVIPDLIRNLQTLLQDISMQNVEISLHGYRYARSTPLTLRVQKMSASGAG